MTNYINEMLDFIYDSPNSYLAVDNIKKELLNKGYIEYIENSNMKFIKGQKYFVTRNLTSIIAFNIGKTLNKPSINMVASHLDCPSYKIKPNAIIKNNGYTKLNVEGYGGMIKRSWLDRPLSLAGRVLVKDNNKIISKLINIKEPIMIIPSLAIHLNRELDNTSLNQQIDMLPLISLDQDYDFNLYISKYLNINIEDLISFDLFLYPLEKGYIWDKMVSSYHLDNLQCAYTSLVAFINNFKDDNINIYISFDNEEVGSRTRQGASSKFLYDILVKLSNDLSFDLNIALASSLFVSADNAHAIHPNHPDKSDKTNHTLLNKGIVIKYNANQSYTSDGLSSALFIEAIKESKALYQFYTNRSDMPSGGTLGYINVAQVSALSVDIGLPQLSMHSTLETAGIDDIEYMINALKIYYQKTFELINDGQFIIK